MSIFKVKRSDLVETCDSGFKTIDQKTKGFRYGNTYLVSGIEKSGKTSFLLQMANYLMGEGKSIAYLNTELKDSEFRTALTALHYNKTKPDVENDILLQKEWVDKHKNLLSYSSVEDLTSEDNDRPNFENLVKNAKEFYKKGVRIFFFDNISTFANQNSNKSNWEILSDCGSRVINFAKRSDVLCFIVVHAKNDVSYSEIPAGIKQFIEDNTPDKIFDESLSVVKRITSNDVHGGSVFRSQLSGSILIWRPLQNFAKSETLPRMTGVILESFRHSESGAMLRMEFDGAKGMFIERVEPTSKKQAENMDWYKDIAQGGNQ